MKDDRTRGMGFARSGRLWTGVGWLKANVVVVAQCSTYSFLLRVSGPSEHHNIKSGFLFS